MKIKGSMELENLIEEVFKIIEFMIGILGAIIGIIAGYFIRKNIGEKKIKSAEELADQIIEDAKKEGESLKKELLIEGKEEIHKFRSEAERENKERRIEVQKLEK